MPGDGGQNQFGFSIHAGKHNSTMHMEDTVYYFGWVWFGGWDGCAALVLLNGG